MLVYIAYNYVSYVIHEIHSQKHLTLDAYWVPPLK